MKRSTLTLGDIKSCNLLDRQHQREERKCAVRSSNLMLSKELYPAELASWTAMKKRMKANATKRAKAAAAASKAERKAAEAAPLQTAPKTSNKI
jgi:hypothetical protein